MGEKQEDMRRAGSAPADRKSEDESCDVASALTRLESAVCALVSGPLTPEFLRRLRALKLVDGVEFDQFVDLLNASRLLESALIESGAGRA